VPRYSQLRWSLVAILVATSAAACGSPGAGSARPYPSSAIDLVVPFQPGGGSDNLARAIQDIIANEKLVDQPLTISNRAGGSGAVGFTYVASRRNDPYSLVTMNDSLVSLTLQPGYSGPNIHDVRIIAILALDDEMIVVPTASRFKTIQDVIAEARTRPRALTLATEANGGGDHILAGLIEMATGASFTYVHTRGGAEAMQHVSGGHVDLAGPNPSEGINQLRGGLVRALAVSSPERLAMLPDVPTLKESGIDVQYRMFRGIGIPKDAPEEAVRFWEAVLKRVADSPRWRTQYIEKFALTPRFLAGDEARAFVTRLEALNRDTLRHLGVAARSN
jgi:putative tricarboxylic transport membrane protein